MLKSGLSTMFLTLLLDDAPWIFMFHAFNVVASSNKVKNIVLNPDFNILHLERVYLEG